MIIPATSLSKAKKITAIGSNLTATADTVIDAAGLLVLPGGIDPHVHLDMPFMGTFSSDTHETGTRAALFGGTTTVIDFVLQDQGHSLKEALGQWKQPRPRHRRRRLQLSYGRHRFQRFHPPGDPRG